MFFLWQEEYLRAYYAAILASQQAAQIPDPAPTDTPIEDNVNGPLGESVAGEVIKKEDDEDEVEWEEPAAGTLILSTYFVSNLIINDCISLRIALSSLHFIITTDPSMVLVCYLSNVVPYFKVIRHSGQLDKQMFSLCHALRQVITSPLVVGL